jgi:hypothetical protein
MVKGSSPRGGRRGLSVREGISLGSSDVVIDLRSPARTLFSGIITLFFRRMTESTVYDVL